MGNRLLITHPEHDTKQATAAKEAMTATYIRGGIQDLVFLPLDWLCLHNTKIHRVLCVRVVSIGPFPELS